MKKLFLASAFAFFTLAAVAQPEPQPEHTKRTPEQIAQHQANALSEHLALTEAQRSKAYTVFLDNARKKEQVMAARRKEMQKLRKQEETIAKQEDAKIEQLLTADQKKTFQLFAGRREKRFDHPRFDRKGRNFAGNFGGVGKRPMDRRFRGFADRNDRMGDPNRNPMPEGSSRDDRNSQPGENRHKNNRPPFSPKPERPDAAPDSTRVAPETNPATDSK